MQVKTQTDDLLNYLTDASNMQGGYADKLLIPESVGEICSILREANESGIPVFISGARTGTVGGAIPFGGSVLSLEKLNKIIRIDREVATAVVEPGVILGDLTKAVDAEGMFYPPDPTEWSCQVGGTVATNASGARSFKYGATREYVQRLEVVLADGIQLDIRRGEYLSDAGQVLSIPRATGSPTEIKVPTYIRPNVRKNVSGYYNDEPLDAIDLFIGSEGTLGVIVEIELKLVERPEGLFSGIVFFKDNVGLQGFVREARELSFAHRPANDRASLDATLIEYFDDRALAFISEKFPET
ncbi:MAG: FAD-binding oxidoreductase, partial [Pyrinomonadaceae bacterium]